MKSSEHVRGAAEGFSLLELMIAISILGLVVVLLSDGVQFAGAVWKSQNRAHL
jgi:prepilin-type N-terminal cleavage/methylation domain-containing protein